MEFGGGIKMRKTTKKVQIYFKVKIDDFWSIFVNVDHQDSMMLRFEHNRRSGDDWIITNDRRKDDLNELTKSSHKASHEILQVDLLFDIDNKLWQ